MESREVQNCSVWALSCSKVGHKRPTVALTSLAVDKADAAKSPRTSGKACGRRCPEHTKPPQLLDQVLAWELQLHSHSWGLRGIGAYHVAWLHGFHKGPRPGQRGYRGQRGNHGAHARPTTRAANERSREPRMAVARALNSAPSGTGWWQWSRSKSAEASEKEGMVVCRALR